MIHELFGGGVSATATLLAGERNPSNSINGGAGGGGVLLPPTTQSPSTTTTVTATATSSASENQNLRCPRCDSSNTKFCYYNNYNLTQPRHFCKTCRRYWTKGGALRNVPIGGGCRKNRSIGGLSNSSAAVKTTAAAKMKTVASEFINGRSPSSGSLLGHGHGFEIENKVLAPPAAAAPSQILWGSPQNSSHVLALLRASQSPNPNTVSGVAVKEEGNYLNLMRSHPQSHMVTEPLVSINSNGLLNNNRSYDGGVGNVLYSSFWRNNQDHQPQQQQNNGGFLLGEQTQYQNSGIIQGLYQKLWSSSGNNNYCSSETSPVFLGNVASNSSSISNNILESTSVAGGELGYWNPTLSWSDLPVPTTTNGAYP